MKIEIGKISHSRKILVSPPLQRQSRAPADVLTLAPPPTDLDGQSKKCAFVRSART